MQIHIQATASPNLPPIPMNSAWGQLWETSLINSPLHNVPMSPAVATSHVTAGLALLLAQGWPSQAAEGTEGRKEAPSLVQSGFPGWTFPNLEASQSLWSERTLGRPFCPQVSQFSKTFRAQSETHSSFQSINQQPGLQLGKEWWGGVPGEETGLVPGQLSQDPLHPPALPPSFCSLLPIIPSDAVCGGETCPRSSSLLGAGRLGIPALPFPGHCCPSPLSSV